MKKYKVEIPSPKAKRMQNGKIILSVEDGWGQGFKKEFDIPIEKIFEFELQDEIEYIGTTSCTDGLNFDIMVEYSNPTGSRKERYSLIPS